MAALCRLLPVTPYRSIRQLYDREPTFTIRSFFQLSLFSTNAKRDANKPDFMIGYRFSPEEREDGGLRLHHTFGLLDYLCGTGVSYLHASLERYDRTSYFDDTLIAKALLDCIRRRKPLIGVGKIRTKQDVAHALELGFDHVALGTTLLLNPEWKISKDPHQFIAEETIPADIPPRMRLMLLAFFAREASSSSKTNHK